MTVDIIIPNYNGANLVKKNLPSVAEALQGYSGKIIIIDDGSNNEDYNRLEVIINSYKKQDIKVQLVSHKKNKGFSSAINTGVRTSDADFVVLLNSDVVPDKEFLKGPIKKLLQNEKLFGVGCVDKSVEGEKIVLRGRGTAFWKRGLLIHEKGEIDREDTFWISGGSSIIRRNIFEKIGGMDEIYNPFYWEDIDLSYRAQKGGYSILFDKESVVTHRHEEGAIKKHFSSNSINKIAYRNQFIFIWKNITSKRLIFSHIIYLPIHILGAVKRGDRVFLNGLFLAISLLPDIMVRRKNQKKLYTISDVEIIKSIS